MSSRLPPDFDGPEKRQRMVEDVIKELTKGDKPPTDEEKIVEESKAITKKVWALYELQVKATPSLRFNKRRATEFLASAFINEFRHLDKERLLFLVAMLHTEVVLENM